MFYYMLNYYVINEYETDEGMEITFGCKPLQENDCNETEDFEQEYISNNYGEKGL